MRRRQEKKKRRFGKWIVVLLFLIVCVNWANGRIPRLFSQLPVSGLTNLLAVHQTATDKHGWNLILVNRENYIPENYTVELTELANGQEVDSRIYPALQEMLDAARAQGLHLFVADGCRTQETQQRILDEKIEAYKKEGYSDSEAEKKAKEWVAVPGTSEHQLGLAVDINADTAYSTSDTVYQWLAQNAHLYGFINRYPADKTEITGTIYEPWHYRYVGKEAAQEIYSQGLCLEEYIERLG